MKRIVAIFLTLLMIFICAGCGDQNKNSTDSNQNASLRGIVVEALKHRLVDGRLDYSSDEYWYQTDRKIDKDKIDVFYSLSTALVSAKDEDGNPSFYTTLSNEDKAIMEEEYKYISTKMFDEEHFNFIAPYYRQVTFETYELTDKNDSLRAYSTAVTDICDAFDYYMENDNNGRPFILAGFSQGGLMTQALLMHMTDEQYSRMIAAYSMGFQVEEAELDNAHIKPAESADDLGVIISYNSVESTDTMWDQIEGNAAICINPLNWKTDDTPASLKYDGDQGEYT